MPFTNLLERVGHAGALRADETPRAIFEVRDLGHEDAAVALAGARFDLVLQRGPGGEAVFAGQDELRIVQGQRHGREIAIGPPKVPRMTRADALERGRLEGSRGPQQLARLFPLLLEIRP